MFLDFDAATSIYRDQVRIHSIKQKQTLFPTHEHFAPVRGELTTAATAVAATKTAVTAATIAPTGGDGMTPTGTQQEQDDEALLKNMTNGPSFMQSAPPEINSGRMDVMGSPENTKQRKDLPRQRITRSSSADTFLKIGEKRLQNVSRLLQEKSYSKAKPLKDNQMSGNSRITLERKKDEDIDKESVSAKAQKRLQRSRPWRISKSPRLSLMSYPNCANGKAGILSTDAGKRRRRMEMNIAKLQTLTGLGKNPKTEDNDGSRRVRVNKLDMKIDGSRLDEDWVSFAKSVCIDSVKQSNGVYSDGEMGSNAVTDANCKIHTLGMEMGSYRPLVNHASGEIKELLPAAATTATTTATTTAAIPKTGEDKGVKEGPKTTMIGSFPSFGVNEDSEGIAFIMGKELSDATDYKSQHFRKHHPQRQEQQQQHRLFVSETASGQNAFQASTMKIEDYLADFESNQPSTNFQLETHAPSNVNDTHLQTLKFKDAASQQEKTFKHPSKIPIAIARRTASGSPEKSQALTSSTNLSSRSGLHTFKSRSAPLVLQKSRNKTRPFKIWNSDKSESPKPKTSAMKNNGSYHKLYCAAAGGQMKRKNRIFMKNSSKSKLSAVETSLQSKHSLRRNSASHFDQGSDENSRHLGNNVSTEGQSVTAHAGSSHSSTHNKTPTPASDSCHNKVNGKTRIISGMTPFLGTPDEYDVSEGKQGLQKSDTRKMSRDSCKKESQNTSTTRGSSKGKQPPFTRTQRGRPFDNEGNKLPASIFGDFSDGITWSSPSKSKHVGKGQKLTTADLVSYGFHQNEPEMAWNASAREQRLINYIEQITNDRMGSESFCADAEVAGHSPQKDFRLKEDRDLRRKLETLFPLKTVRQSGDVAKGDGYAKRNRLAKLRKGRMGLERNGFYGDCRARPPSPTISNVYTQTCLEDGNGSYCNGDHAYTCYDGIGDGGGRGGGGSGNGCVFNGGGNCANGGGGCVCNFYDGAGGGSDGKGGGGVCSFYGGGGSGKKIGAYNHVMRGPISSVNSFQEQSIEGEEDESPSVEPQRPHSEYSDDVDDGDNHAEAILYDDDGSDEDEGEEDQRGEWGAKCLNCFQNTPRKVNDDVFMSAATKLKIDDLFHIDEHMLAEFNNVLTTLYSEARLAAEKARKVKAIIDEVAIAKSSTLPSGRIREVGDREVVSMINRGGQNQNGNNNEWEGTFGDFLLLVGFMMIQISVHLLINDVWGVA